MYQLIDHIFYDGRHLFEQGEQALRLREKPLGCLEEKGWRLMVADLVISRLGDVEGDLSIAKAAKDEL